MCQILLLPVIGTGELWYPVYLLPLAALGVTHLARQTEPKLSPRLIAGPAAVILVICFVHENISRLSKMCAAQDRGDAGYRAWCTQVSALIPHGSKVLLSVIPDPYFGLLSRPDLQLREFLPERIPVDPQKYSRYIGEADYIVVGVPWSPSSVVADFASSKDQIVGTVGGTSSETCCARIYRLPKGDFSPTSHDRNLANPR